MACSAILPQPTSTVQFQRPTVTTRRVWLTAPTQKLQTPASYQVPKTLTNLRQKTTVPLGTSRSAVGAANVFAHEAPAKNKAEGKTNERAASFLLIIFTSTGQVALSRETLSGQAPR